MSGYMAWPSIRVRVYGPNTSVGCLVPKQGSTYNGQTKYKYDTAV